VRKWENLDIMKVILKNFFLIFFAIIFVTLPIFSNAAGEQVKIKSIDSEIVIGKDGIVYVTENILADFSLSPGHGIYRDIPYVYQNKDGSKLYTEIYIINVKDENNKHYIYSITKNSANLRIKIGDPNVLAGGVERYIISYSVKGILSSFDAYDEIYWNATGTGWTSGIDNSSAVVILPEDGVVQAACYKGSYGSQTPCDSKEVGTDRVNFSATNLNKGEAFTVAVGFRKGLVPILSIPKPTNDIWAHITLNNILIFSVTLLIGILGIFILWWKNGRDIWYKRKSLFDPDAKEETMPLGAHETIVAEYDSPEGLRPGEIGVIMDETADTLDISATIVDLAIRGYIKIIEIPKKLMFGSVDYRLEKLKEADDKMMAYEKELFVSLFETAAANKILKKFIDIRSWRKGSLMESLQDLRNISDDGGKISTENSVLLSELKNKFYKELSKVKSLLYQDVYSKKLFLLNPQKVRNKHWAYAGLTAGIGFFLWVFRVFPAFSLAFSIVFLAYGIIGVRAMPQRTAYGREIYRKARGYKLFLENTEKYRQPFFENENTFMNVLPYAMVFKITKKLAKAMEDMGIQPQQPVWFVGSGNAFNVTAFGSSMDSLSNSLSSAIASAPGGSGSGGGGGAGGGGGGGGGGW